MKLPPLDLMPPRAVIALLLLLALAMCGCAGRAPRPKAPLSGEARAIAFLVREVPAWSRDNGCFSCHNNGDAARALYAAKRGGFTVAAAALADTTAWVRQPSRWEHNKGDPGFSDQRLANLQFAASLLAAVESGQSDTRAALLAAARKVAAGQGEDGAWRIESQDILGSPATYGTALATFSAWRVLTETDAPETKLAATKAAEWLRLAPMDNVPAVAVALRFSLRDSSPVSTQRRADAFARLRRAQTTDGGWGPYADTPAEAFDTALALLALAELPHEADVATMVRRGRSFLLAQQRADGDWAATTRPSGGESYAQRMSTTGWATLALLKTGLARTR
ncbi:MAG: hypothetical protein ABMA26_10800 [Limisphaerales bacterium]